MPVIKMHFGYSQSVTRLKSLKLGENNEKNFLDLELRFLSCKAVSLISNSLDSKNNFILSKKHYKNIKTNTIDIFLE